MPTTPENSEEKQGNRFRKGQSGNPAGKPKGARHRTTLAAEELLDGEAEALTRKAINLALKGDTTALRLCLERIVPPRKSRRMPIDLPKIEKPEDLLPAFATVVSAMAAGDISPSEAVIIADVLEAKRKVLELVELEARLKRLEELMRERCHEAR